MTNSEKGESLEKKIRDIVDNACESCGDCHESCLVLPKKFASVFPELVKEYTEFDRCNACEGRGFMECFDADGLLRDTEECEDCQGKGQILKMKGYRLKLHKVGRKRFLKGVSKFLNGFTDDELLEKLKKKERELKVRRRGHENKT